MIHIVVSMSTRSLWSFVSLFITEVPIKTNPGALTRVGQLLFHVPEGWFGCFTAGQPFQLSLFLAGVLHWADYSIPHSVFNAGSELLGGSQVVSMVMDVSRYNTDTMMIYDFLGAGYDYLCFCWEGLGLVPPWQPRWGPVYILLSMWLPETTQSFAGTFCSEWHQRPLRSLWPMQCHHWIQQSPRHWESRGMLLLKWVD